MVLLMLKAEFTLTAWTLDGRNMSVSDMVSLDFPFLIFLQKLNFELGEGYKRKREFEV